MAFPILPRYAPLIGSNNFDPLRPRPGENDWPWLPAGVRISEASLSDAMKLLALKPVRALYNFYES